MLVLPVDMIIERLKLLMQEIKSVKVQRFYRPEDISADLGYRAGFWDIYASSEQEEVDVEDVQALCQVRRSNAPTGGRQHTSSSGCTGLKRTLASEGNCRQACHPPAGGHGYIRCPDAVSSQAQRCSDGCSVCEEECNAMLGLIGLFEANDEHSGDAMENLHGPALQMSQSCQPPGAWHAACFQCFAGALIVCTLQTGTALCAWAPTTASPARSGTRQRSMPSQAAPLARRQTAARAS